MTTQPQNIYLVGPMGSGKTAVGRRLAQDLGREFADSDTVIEARTGVDIPFIFEKEGEAGFRDRETDVIDELTRKPGLVLATGGGAILSDDNRSRLASRGFVIYLSASVDQQLHRTRRGKGRPLLNTGDRFRDGAVEAGWAQVQTPEFKAFCELSMAARTDAELDQVFRSSLEAFDRARRDAALHLAEPEVAASPVFDLRRDIHRLVLEGLAKQDGIAFDVERRSDELFAFLKLLWSDQGEEFLAKALDRS